jgi:signal transduction histidine kinase
MRIARDLHDTTVQDASGAILQLENVSHQLSQAIRNPNDPTIDIAALQQHVLLASQSVRWITQRLRRTMWSLHAQEEPDDSPAVTESNPLLSHAIEPLLAQLPDSLGLRFEVIGEERRVERSIVAELVTIVTEGLTNIVRHAHATEVSVLLVFGTKSLEVSLQDNGRGFDSERQSAQRHAARADGSGFGLVGIRERVESLHGTLHLSSRPGEGTRIQVGIPLPPVRLVQ